MSSSDARAWRAAFLTLRDETLTPPSPAAALRLLRPVLTSRDALAAAAPQLPPHEVTSDLSLLLELASSLDTGSPAAPDAFVSASHFIYVVNCKIRLEANSLSWTPLLTFIEKLVSCLSGGVERRKQMLRDSLWVESILNITEVLRFFMTVHGEKCSLTESTHLAKVLFYIISCLPIESISGAHSVIHSRQVTGLGIRVQLFALTGISDTLTKIGTSLPVHIWQYAVEALRKVMDTFTSNDLLIESASMSRPSLPPANAVIKSMPSSSIMNPGVIGSRKADDGPYKPPHLRKREQQEQGVQMFSSLELLKCNLTSSDSEQSDSDGFTKDTDRFRSSKARIAALLCIQDICQVDPKSLTSVLTVLLPTNNILLQRKNQGTIITSLLFDPVLKVRITSASTLISILEGQSQFLSQVSEYKETTKLGSFTSISSSLGQMLMQVHKGIMYLIQHEAPGGLLASVLKAFMLLISTTPYSRMPAELLPSVILSIARRIIEESSAPKSDLNTMASAFSCMALALSTASPSVSVLDMLKKEVITGNLTILDMVLLFAQGNYNPNIRFEALKVLQAIAHNYSHITNTFWEPISFMIYEILRTPILEDFGLNAASNARRGETRNISGSNSDKCKVAAVKALDGCLRASSGFKGVDDPLECKLEDTQCSINCEREIRVSSAPLYVLDDPKIANGSSSEFSNGSKHWSEALEKHIPLVLKHSSPLVRAASVTCFAGLTSSVFFSLTKDEQNLIKSFVIDATLNDNVPSVRSSGCRALGVLSSFSQIFSRKAVLDEFVHAANANLHDSSLSVRITASWALANICDSLRHLKTDSYLKISDQLLDSDCISILVESALRLTSDSDKVKANAVRALGNLSRFVKFTEYFCSPKYQNSSRVLDNQNLHWLERMVQAFVSCVTTGNVKVQWNVCYSLGNLFLNPTVRLQDVSWSSSVFTILLLLLRDSTNFKIRIHAAVALAVPSSKLDYGSSFSTIVQGIVLVLETLDTDLRLVPSNAKYRDSLDKQLAMTTLHVLGYCSPEDDHALECFLVKKASFLEDWLKCLCSKFFTTPEKAVGEPEGEGRSTSNEPLKAILASALKSLIVVYKCSSNRSIASRLEVLLDDLS